MKKPIIRWAGSKRKLIPLLLNNIPSDIETYFEPFCGSASLFFELNVENAVLSDINQELINALQIIKKGVNFYHDLCCLPQTKDEYLSQRSKRIELLNEKERAIRFLYLNRFCFNGVYRTNKSGLFNVPYGNRTGDFPSEDTFLAAQHHLTRADICVADYKETLSRVKKNDFVYLDPPYSKNGRFTGEYGVGSFNENDIVELFTRLKNVDTIGARFLLSYRADDAIRQIIPNNYSITEVEVYRHIAGFKTKWMNAKEILVKNYE